jgi:hypothetical protein
LGQQILDAVSSSLNYPKAHLLLLWPCCLSLAIQLIPSLWNKIINKIYIGTWQIRPFPNLADQELNRKYAGMLAYDPSSLHEEYSIFCSNLRNYYSEYLVEACCMLSKGLMHGNLKY